MEDIKVEQPPCKRKKVENGATNVINGSTKARIRVGSRKSQLALFQSNFVVDLLKENYGSIKYDIITMTTTGDKILDVALSKIGEKSLFTKELEVALEKLEVDIIVHSLKDLPTSLPPGMVIGAICKRENPFDVAVFPPDSNCKDLKSLPPGSVIGTSSLRRVAQLRKMYPNLAFQSVRGNLNTRLRKLDEDKTFSALILAAAGLIRLDLANRIDQTFTPEECMHAVGQGALAIECREDDLETIQLISKISDKDTTLCCIAERSFMKTLEGGCSVPVAVYSKIEGKKLTLQGGVFSLDGCKSIIEKISTEIEHADKCVPKQHYAGVIAPRLPQYCLCNAEHLGMELAELLLSKGAADILKEARAKNDSS
ncbi:porphobilinogen deaminase-like isoform X2 [Stegodyphus dumicola]|uniref:porphobilinogen deaminase-like isoform X2 n=1 Tax=Stegodyphus dumicola TaxID=202533 RepID=UPI0015A7DBAA|nr:porphobilinogen deaminase-like isoform X2 [Stegodyphus dumicola]